MRAFICGGNWNEGVHYGPRTVNGNNSPWNVNANIGSRLACDSKKIGKITKGVEFVGYKIYPKGKMIKKQTIYKTRRFVNKFLKGEVKAEKFCKSIASMCGHAVHTDNYMFYVRQLLKVIRFLLGCQS